MAGLKIRDSIDTAGTCLREGEWDRAKIWRREIKVKKAREKRSTPKDRRGTDRIKAL